MDSNDHISCPEAAGLPPACRLLRALRSAVEGVEGCRLTYDRLALITAKPRSTLSRWLEGEAEPSVTALLRLWERLPIQQRHEILGKFLRAYPTLGHPSLAHDPASVGHCGAVLAKNRGLTLVRGGETPVTFVMTAFAHSLQLSAAPRRKVLGIDAHSPDWFVPAENISYLADSRAPDRIEAELRGLFRRNPRGATILLNVGAAASVLLDEIFAAADRNHVLLADTTLTQRLRLGSQPHQLIEVTLSRSQPERIQLQVGAG